VLSAAHLLGLAAGTHLRDLRAQKDALPLLHARLEEAELRARLAWETAELLRDRFAKIPERHRPHFTPAQRFRVLEIRSLLAWNARETARLSLLSTNTVLNWEKTADPHARTVGAAVQPVPPVRRAADVVRATAQLMTRMGFGGIDLCSRVLARAGWRVSARSIGRYRRERATPPSTPTPEPTSSRPTKPVVARFVHHVWMMDVTEVKQFLGPTLYMAAVFDAFSRVPLALRVFDSKPAALDMARLLRASARVFKRPKYLITDLGSEFTGKAFVKLVRRLGVVHRFASRDSLKATARLERFWRTLKETTGLYRLHLPLSQEDLEARLELSLLHYLCFRPHEGLGGAVPAEAFLGIEPAHRMAVEAPRGRPGEGPIEPPFQVEHLDPRSRRFPVLKQVA
jgi:transposase InsO family protein